MIRIIHKWLMYGECADGTEIYGHGHCEEYAMQDLIDKSEKHGGLIYYTGVTDEDRVDGEYIGRENFIY